MRVSSRGTRRRPSRRWPRWTSANGFLIFGKDGMNQALFDLLKPYLAGQLRHILGVIAGALIAKGALASDEQGAFTTITSGIVFWAIAAGWSWWQKYGQAAALAGAQKKLAAFRRRPSPSLHKSLQ